MFSQIFISINQNISKLCIFLTLFFIGVNVTTVVAQRKRKAVKVLKENPLDIARKEINKNNFPLAIDILQKTIAEQEKQKRPQLDVELMRQLIDSLEVQIMRIRNTQKIVFVDSVVVSKNKFLSAYNVNREVGRILNTDKLAPIIKTNFKYSGEVAFLNELFDHVYFSQMHDGKNVLCSSIRFGNTWDAPKPIFANEINDEAQDYPFMLTDGITLYYAAKGEGGFGGWDIFVTRYDHETGKYLKPQNLGMPFNTEANDYLYVIDETCNTGYFATDRHHGPDSVCIYTFIPPSVHSSFSSDTPFEVVRNAAYIHSLAASQEGMDDVINSWKANKDNVTKVMQKGVDLHFIINDNIIYTDLSQFKSKEACETAEKLLQLYEKKTTALELVSILRMQYSEQRTDILKDNILKAENELLNCVKEIRLLEKKMRNLEIKALGN